MQFPKKFTISRLAAHDFNRSLRVWRGRLPDIEILKSLVAERSRSVALSMRSLALAIVGTLWLASAKSDITLKLDIIDLSIPVAYVNFGVAALTVGTAIHTFNYFALNDFVRITAHTLFKFDAPGALTTIQDGGSAWINGAIVQYRFLKSGNGHRRFGNAVAILVNLPFIAIFFTIYWTVVKVGIQVLWNAGIWSISGAFTLIAWLLMIYPVAFLIFYFLPFRFAKNVSFIRWGFLFRLYQRESRTPARVDAWIGTHSQLRTRSEIEAENLARTKYLKKKYGL